MRVLVTRPQPQADEWVARLIGAGMDAHALPLIDIGPAADSGAVSDAWRALPTQALAMFVSPNAVSRFFEARPVGLAWPAATWAGSTGPGTTAALRAAGVPEPALVEPAASSAQFDSEALWRVLAPLRDWRGARVTVVRGEGGRDWLAQVLAQRGAVVSFVEAYRRGVPSLDERSRGLLAEAVARPAEHVWIFSSSESIGNLEALSQGLATAAESDAVHADIAMHAGAASAQARTRWTRSRALTSHPRIAERAKAAGFGAVLQAAPTLNAVLAGLRSLQARDG